VGFGLDVLLRCLFNLQASDEQWRSRSRQPQQVDPAACHGLCHVLGDEHVALSLGVTASCRLLLPTTHTITLTDTPLLLSCCRYWLCLSLPRSARISRCQHRQQGSRPLLCTLSSYSTGICQWRPYHPASSTCTRPSSRRRTPQSSGWGRAAHH
jgi:hypothetical protein